MNRISFKRRADAIVLSAVSLCITVAATQTVIPVEAAETLVAKEIDQQKLAVAKHLTEWMQNRLLHEKAIVAVVARKGGKDVKSRDSTGMAHSGLAIYDPRAQTWILYQVLNVPHNGVATAELWRSAPLDFFYGQTGYEENALILTMDEETQKRIYDSILSGDASKLVFTTKYNLLSTYDSSESLNCNKWILMTIAAARTADFDPQHALQAIREGFEPAKLRFGFFAKQVVKHKSNVQQAELPSSGAIQTVTPESLCKSGLFKNAFFVDRTLTLQ